MPEIQIPNMFNPQKICITCIICGGIAREEYFTENIDILVCDECKEAIEYAKELKKRSRKVEDEETNV